MSIQCKNEPARYISFEFLFQENALVILKVNIVLIKDNALHERSRLYQPVNNKENHVINEHKYLANVRRDPNRTVKIFLSYTLGCNNILIC